MIWVTLVQVRRSRRAMSERRTTPDSNSAFHASAVVNASAADFGKPACSPVRPKHVAACRAEGTARSTMGRQIPRIVRSEGHATSAGLDPSEFVGSPRQPPPNHSPAALPRRRRPWPWARSCRRGCDRQRRRAPQAARSSSSGTHRLGLCHVEHLSLRPWEIDHMVYRPGPENGRSCGNHPHLSSRAGR